MKKPTRKTVLFFFLLFCTASVFAAGGNGGKEWVDTSILYMIDMFSGNMSYFMICALRIARLMLILMLLWNFIQMIIGTMEGRKVFIGSVTKWIFFLLVLHLYPGFSYGLRNLAIEMGIGASGTSIAGLTTALGKYMDDLEAKIKAETADQFNALIQGAQSEFEMYKAQYDAQKAQYDALEAKYNALSNKNGAAGRQTQAILNNALSGAGGLNELELKMRTASQNVEQRKKEQRMAVEGNTLGANRTLQALKRVLIKNGTDVTAKYRLDMGLKTSSGADTGLLSPNALFRIGTLAAQIMWEKEWTVIDAEMTDNKENAFLFKNSNIMNFPVSRLFDLLLVIIAIVALIVVLAACLIQYIMAIVEYVITSTFAVVLIPLMLFDPLKDMSQKVLPALFAQAVKLVFIVMAMFFSCFVFLQLATNLSEQTSGFDLNTFGYVIFTGLLAAAFCVFAPKWAQTLLTGQPQMSMGEFVAASVAAVKGATFGVGAVKGGYGAVKGGAQKVSSGAVNGLGQVAGMVGAGSAAKQAAAAEGKGKLGQIGASLKGAAQEGTSRFAGSLKEKAENFVRGNGKGGKSGTGGMGDVSGRTPNASADKVNGDLSNTRDYSRHQTTYTDKTGQERKRASTLREYWNAQAQAGQANQKARIEKKKKDK